MAKVALLIGVSEYKPGFDPLPAAVKDVEAIRRVLLNPEMGDFALEDITVLKNPQPLQMQYAIYNLFTNRQNDDLVLLYFSGHGIKDESGRLYLASCETYKENGSLVKPSAVEARQLHDSMNESRSQRQVIILDCCFSGAIAKGLTVKDDGRVDIQTQLGGKGRAILTSSTSTQSSFAEESSELSVYTRYLVEGIEKGAADKDGDGYITVDELHDYAFEKVKEASPAMTPKFYPVEEGFKIKLAKAPVDDPRLKYRKAVESIAKEDEGEISVVNQLYLDELRNNLGLSPGEAKAIDSEVLQPYHQRQEKLRRYEQALSKTIQQKSQLTEKDYNAFKRLQTILNLRDEDIAPIEQRVLGEKKVQEERKQEKTTEESSSVIKTKQFQFEFVTLIPTQKRSRLFGLFGETVYEQERTRSQAEFFTEHLGNGVTLEMVAIPGGSFVMGSPESEAERSDSESPQHTVTIKPFFMGKFPVTQEQYQAIMNENPSHFKGEKRPVECVSWDQAIAFCTKLSQKTGKTYRLPSEAEWEYACRAGTTTPFHFGDTIATDLANYNASYTYGLGVKSGYSRQTTQVKKFLPNACGLYDMHGNVWEWCQDTWHNSYEGAPVDGGAWVSDNKNNSQKQVLRGGSWNYSVIYCRSACRTGFACLNTYVHVGFRVTSSRFS
jgi:formylglycine-generating enzyme required for sulfatase activity